MKKSNMTAMAMAAMMIMANVSPAVVAYADVTISSDSEKTTKVDTIDGITATKGTVNADAVTKNVDASGENTTVKVTGAIGGTATATNNATVTAGTSINNVDAKSGAKVNAGSVTGTVTADGSETEVKVTGNAGGVAATNSASVTAGTVSGSVNAQSGADVSAGSVTGQVTANGSGTTVEVTGTAGSVDAKTGAKVEANTVTGKTTADGSGTTVEVTGTAGEVVATSKATVTAEKVIGTITADGSTVVVKGDVTDEDSGDGTYTVDAKNGAKVTIEGDLVSKDGEAIKLTGNVAVIVKKDVEASADENISIDASGAEGGTVAIEGTLKNGEAGATLVVAGTNGEIDNKNNLPEIVVGTVEDLKNLKIETSGGDEGSKEVSDEDRAAIIKNIKYIINQEDLQNGVLSITKLEGGAVDRDSSGTYNVATAGTYFKVNIAVKEGYELSSFSAGNESVVWENGTDGSYIVRMPAGGGISLNAVLKLIEKAEDTKVPEDTKAPETTTTTTTTVTRTSSGGGSGSGSSSGFHAINVTPGMGRTNLQNTPGSWQKNADNTWSYVGTDGTAYKSDWIVSNNRWYYADANGKITTGWVEINGVWYYFTVSGTSENPEGSMLAGTTTPDGYKLDGNGAWVK